MKKTKIIDRNLKKTDVLSSAIIYKAFKSDIRNMMIIRNISYNSNENLIWRGIGLLMGWF